MAATIQNVQIDKFLDNCFYHQIPALISNPSLPVSFDRITDPFIKRQGTDVLMQEGPHIIHIKEIYLSRPDAKALPFEVSFQKDGIVEGGWVLDSRKETDFFLFSYPETKQEGFLSYHVLLISKSKLLSALDGAGYDRAGLAIREELIRKSRHLGRYATNRPEFWLYYHGTNIYLMIAVRMIKRVAAADVHVVYDTQLELSQLSGNWLNNIIFKHWREKGIIKPGRLQI